MSQRRDIEARLLLFDDLSGILGAMRSFALAELRRVGKRESAQQQVVQSLSAALNDVSDAFPDQAIDHIGDQSRTINEIWLLFGSVRGFCGSFNEDVVQFWRNASGERGALILVGERLHGMVSGDAQPECINGANGCLDATSAMDEILSSIEKLRNHDNPFRLTACIRDEDGPRSQRLWPLPAAGPRSRKYPPLTYAPLAEIAVNIAEHYLFHSLLSLLLRSIKVENHMRLLQMDTALRHLEQTGEELRRQRNRLRQEEIIEEIELMAISKR